MGCCNSIPHREENTRSTINNNVIREQSTIGDANIKKPEAAVTSSLNSTDNAEKKEPYGSPQPLPSLPPSSGNPYPILVRLSSDGQDITIQLPTEPPYLSNVSYKP
ncbi:hypothetical protein G6F62_013779 [Rhizopus arrhizus]|nr:hypothetical protein G6F62_013779 [Rhizopus arrhizus]